MISRFVKKSRRASLKDITTEFNRSALVNLSRRTIQRKLHVLGYTERSVRKPIGIREVNKRKELQSRGVNFTGLPLIIGKT